MLGVTATTLEISKSSTTQLNPVLKRSGGVMAWLHGYRPSPDGLWRTSRELDEARQGALRVDPVQSRLSRVSHWSWGSSPGMNRCSAELVNGPFEGTFGQKVLCVRVQSGERP